MSLPVGGSAAGVLYLEPLHPVAMLTEYRSLFQNNASLLPRRRVHPTHTDHDTGILPRCLLDMSDRGFRNTHTQTLFAPNLWPLLVPTFGASTVQHGGNPVDGQEASILRMSHL